MALQGVKVIELAGLAPAPFCGMLLSDFGATVTLIERVRTIHWKKLTDTKIFRMLQTPDNPVDVLATGKRAIALNLKHAKAKAVIRQLCSSSDVLIEPYRPGVMEKLGLGPAVLLAHNPRLIYARLTGFGQSGPLAARAGHDINYVGMSGILSLLGRKDEKPTPPVNLLADMAGGGLLCAFGICTALLERHRSGRGQIVDSSMTEGAAYVASWLTRSQTLPIWGKPRGENVLDSNAFYYDTYETKDGRYMSVGALEPQFFKAFIDGIDLPDLQQYSDDNAMAKELVTQQFKTRTQAEWTKLFGDIDACVFPVLDWQTANQHPHNIERETFVNQKICDGVVIPSPAPRLSRTPAMSSVMNKTPVGPVEILMEAGYDELTIRELSDEGALILPINAKL